MTEQSRKEFGIFVDDKGYCEFSTQIASEAWQASEARILTLLDSDEMLEVVAKNIFDLICGDPEDDEQNPWVQSVAKSALQAIKQKIGERDDR